ncbi:MAG: 50S ribosomal protein L10 [Phycisphaerales bacterium]|jgi:large subunit ribosomal protein L10|nr:50S ribosomal protein L10 [Phycisphaerales bacterium]MBT7170315.1 50S ribosomal protein L10 [Phycisphaerales bacterium]
MSKPIKEMMRDELIQRFDDADSVAICGFTGLDAEATYNMRGRLQDKEINFTVVKNSLARAAFKKVGLDTAIDMLDGPCAVAWGSDSIVTVVRELLDIQKNSGALTIKGAVLDGDVFAGDAAVKQLSTFPTRDEAIADVVGCVLSAGANLAGCLMGPSGQVAGILKTIEEKGE